MTSLYNHWIDVIAELAGLVYALLVLNALLKRLRHLPIPAIVALEYELADDTRAGLDRS